MRDVIYGRHHMNFCRLFIGRLNSKRNLVRRSIEQNQKEFDIFPEPFNFYLTFNREKKSNLQVFFTKNRLFHN